MELQILIFDGVVDDFPFRLFDLWDLLDHLFQFAKSGVVADGEGVGGGDFESVMFFGVVGGGDHDRGVEAVSCGEVIYHRGGGEPHVVNICAGVGDAAGEGFEDGR